MKNEATKIPFPGQTYMPFLPERTACPHCDARRGYAPLGGDAGGGKCHACGTFDPPHREARADDRRSDRATARPTTGRRPERRQTSTTRWELATTDDYTDEHGTTLYSVDRYERHVTYADAPHTPEREKTIRQRPAGVAPRQMTDRDGTPIGASLGDVWRVLLGLPAVVSAVREGRAIVLCEGEKCANHLNTFFRDDYGGGYVATAGAGGAGGWRAEYAECLRGATVLIWPDADTAGTALLQAARPDLLAVGATVAIVTPDLVARYLS